MTPSAHQDVTRRGYRDGSWNQVGDLKATMIPRHKLEFPGSRADGARRSSVELVVLVGSFVRYLSS